MTDLIENPYWEAVKDRVTQGEFPWETPCVERFNWRELQAGNAEAAYSPMLLREEMVRTYSWTITDPDSVAFVAMHAVGGLVDPMAGTGYWAYVLNQYHVSTVCYDANPPDMHENSWHQGVSKLWVPVTQRYGEIAIDDHPDRTLMLAWPPYSEGVGMRILREYRGNRVIYMGEGNGGCTGDDDLHEMLEADWTEEDERVPIQWWGLHDRITVYRRKHPLNVKKLAAVLRPKRSLASV